MLHNYYKEKVGYPSIEGGWFYLGKWEGEKSF